MSRLHGARVVVGLLLGVGACGGGDEEPINMLPTATDSSSSSVTADTTAAPETGVEPTADTTAGGSGVTFPATYRFDCIDIVQIGDSDGDGMPDGEAIQGTLLENTWAADIDAFKLNIMLTVAARDEAGMAELLIGSGIGTNVDDLCTETTTASDPKPASFDPAVAQWQPSSTTGVCSEPAVSSDGLGGTYTFELAASDTIYIYAQDTDGTVFNCVPGGGAPNAVPLHAISATVTMDADEQLSAGQLSGCLVDSEAQGLCSCLGVCQGAANPDCGGCPDGSVPLAQLLAGVGATDNCTALMGETAYDLTVGFTSRRLAVDEPMTCG